MNVIKKLSLIFALSLVFLCSCEKKENFKQYDFFAMDTYVSLVAQTDKSFDFIETYVKDIEEIFSKTLPQSEIYKLNENRELTVSDEVLQVLSECVEISKNTHGSFDLSAGALSNLWDVTGKNPKVPKDEDIKIALSGVGYENVEISQNLVKLKNENTQIDLGASVKGYAAEKCIEKIKSEGINDAYISFGGNIAVIGNSENNKKAGKTGWNVGIKNPHGDDIIGYVNITDTTLATSGSYERFFEENGKIYHHIFDTKTGYPSESGLSSCAVISKNGLLADALSTALFVMGKTNAKEFYNQKMYDFEAVVVTDEGEILVTEGIYENFVLNKDAKNKDGKKYTLKVL